MSDHTDTRLEDPLSLAKKVNEIVKQLPMDDAIRVFTYASALSDACLLRRTRNV